jgi:hypothetical protein
MKHVTAGDDEPVVEAEARLQRLQPATITAALNNRHKTKVDKYTEDYLTTPVVTSLPLLSFPLADRFTPGHNGHSTSSPKRRHVSTCTTTPPTSSTRL